MSEDASSDSLTSSVLSSSADEQNEFEKRAANLHLRLSELTSSLSYMPTDQKSLENPPDVEVPKGDYIEADVEAALKNQELR